MDNPGSGRTDVIDPVIAPMPPPERPRSTVVESPMAYTMTFSCCARRMTSMMLRLLKLKLAGESPPSLKTSTTRRPSCPRSAVIAWSSAFHNGVGPVTGCPYQKLHRQASGPSDRVIRVADTDSRQRKREGTPSLCTNGGTAWADETGLRAKTVRRQGSPRATVKPRDVRSGDVNRRRVGPRRSFHKAPVGQPEGREHPCPARGECATRDSSRGTAAGGGAMRAHSTR